MEATSYIIAEPGNPNQLQQQIDDTIARRKPVEQKLKDAQKNLAGLEDSYNSKKSGLFSMFSKKETVEKLGVEVEEAKKQVAAIQAELDSLTVNIDKLQAGVEENQHRTLADLFASISQSKKVWNISLAERHAGKSAAKASFNRNEIALTTADIAVINSKYKPFFMAGFIYNIF